MNCGCSSSRRNHGSVSRTSPYLTCFLQRMFAVSLSRNAMPHKERSCDSTTQTEKMMVYGAISSAKSELSVRRFQGE